MTSITICRLNLYPLPNGLIGSAQSQEKRNNFYTLVNYSTSIGLNLVNIPLLTLGTAVYRLKTEAYSKPSNIHTFAIYRYTVIKANF